MSQPEVEQFHAMPTYIIAKDTSQARIWVALLHMAQYSFLYTSPVLVSVTGGSGGSCDSQWLTTLLPSLSSQNFSWPRVRTISHHEKCFIPSSHMDSLHSKGRNAPGLLRVDLQDKTYGGTATHYQQQPTTHPLLLIIVMTVFALFFILHWGVQGNCMRDIAEVKCVPVAQKSHELCKLGQPLEVSHYFMKQAPQDAGE